MCVIMLIQEKRPTEEMLRKAFADSPDGFGVAWRDKDEVVWKKGFYDLDEINKMVAELPLPFIAHFRKVTIGGRRDSLCHPFEISHSANDALEGRTKGAVLFHNGTWSDWQKHCWEMAYHKNVKMPLGRWNDSRAMAWIASYIGLGFIEWTYDRALAFAPKGVLNPFGIEIMSGSGWEDIEGVWCSNDRFIRGTTSHTGNAYHHGYVVKWCKTMGCSTTSAMETLDADGYCPKHSEKPAKVPPVNGHGAAGGLHHLDPFYLLRTAEHQRAAGKISKGQLKRVRKLCQRLRDNLASDPDIQAALGIETIPPVVIRNGGNRKLKH